MVGEVWEVEFWLVLEVVMAGRGDGYCRGGQGQG